MGREDRRKASGRKTWPLFYDLENVSIGPGLANPFSKMKTWSWGPTFPLQPVSKTVVAQATEAFSPIHTSTPTSHQVIIPTTWWIVLLHVVFTKSHYILSFVKRILEICIIGGCHDGPLPNQNLVWLSPCLLLSKIGILVIPPVAPLLPASLGKGTAQHRGPLETAVILMEWRVPVSRLQLLYPGLGF